LGALETGSEAMKVLLKNIVTPIQAIAPLRATDMLYKKGEWPVYHSLIFYIPVMRKALTTFFSFERKSFSLNSWKYYRT